ncbi:MAG: response regulator transcription factor [Opitutaceae bacterium]|nr:response regulator transcription factor [Opitutaceae bacterium]
MSSPAPIRILLVDDSEVVRLGLRALLDADDGLHVMAEADGVAAAVRAAEQHRPDVVLLDIRLPDGSGFEACRQILRRLPETRVLILTSVVDETLVDEAIRAGAHGYLLKEINGRGLVQALRDVAAGKSILDPAVTARVLQLVKTGGHAAGNTLTLLSPQEKRVLALIASGHTNKEVAAEMGLAEKTVKNYLSTVFEKLHVSRRSQAAALYAQEMNRRV